MRGILVQNRTTQFKSSLQGHKTIGLNEPTALDRNCLYSCYLLGNETLFYLWGHVLQASNRSLQLGCLDVCDGVGAEVEVAELDRKWRIRRHAKHVFRFKITVRDAPVV